MHQRPFLKSIRPVNLLSFGPDTDKIELESLNLLIGPNGSGKSNLIEILRLLHSLPDKDPWRVVLETGGVNEWIWKGKKGQSARAFLNAEFCLESEATGPGSGSRLVEFSVELDKFDSSFRIVSERLEMLTGKGARDTGSNRYERRGSLGEVHVRTGHAVEGPIRFDLAADRSILSQLTALSLQTSGAAQSFPEMFEAAGFFEKFDFHQDWEFGADLSARDPVVVGQAVERLDESGYNLAQMLAYYRDYHQALFERINELMRLFYEPFEGLDVRLIGTHLQTAIKETGGFSTPAYRLSDGTLRWLALLVIFLNPNPAPVTCIEEPELGLHPDIIPMLGDLMRNASKRTQLIVTTHSSALVDLFSDDPRSVCICEKSGGASQIRRLDTERLREWLDDYSLGQLWAKGEIGGNRW